MSFIPPFLVAVIAAGVGAITLKGDFVWDDRVFVLMKEAYWRFDLRAILLSPANGVEYLPVRDLSYALDFALWGAEPWGFHLTNVLLYALNVTAVFLVARDIQLGLDTNKHEHPIVLAAIATALIFATHPIHSEVVSFIICRNLLLCGLFFFLSYWFWLRRLKAQGTTAAGWYLLALGSFVLALFSKATAVTLPVLMILTVMLHPEARRTTLRNLMEVLPFAAISVAATFLFIWVGRQSNIIGSVPQATVTEKLAVSLQIPFFYLSKLLVPVGLCPEYDIIFPRSFADSWGFAVVVPVATLFFMSFLFRRRWFVAFFCAAWFLLALLPHLNLLPTHPVVADRYAYLSSFGFCLFAGHGLVCIGRWYSRSAAACAVMIIIVLGVLAVRQNTFWRTEKSLWSHTMEVAPRSVKAYTELARILFNEGRYELAIELAAEAQRIDPSNPEYDFQLGQLLLLEDNAFAAIEPLNVAVNRDPFFLEGFYHLGKAYERLGRHNEAVIAYNKLLASGGIDFGGYKELAREALRQLIPMVQGKKVNGG